MAGPSVGPSPRRRPIILALVLAAAATVAVVGVVALTRPSGSLIGRQAPDIAGTTLDGAPLRLADLRGQPVVVNFWGPTCIPCRDEFPLLKSKLTDHAADGLVVVGVLMADPPDLARTFIADQGATWQTVDDPDGAIQGGVPRRRSSPDLLHRPRRGSSARSRSARFATPTSSASTA